MSNNRKMRNDSVSGQKSRLSDMSRVIPVPEGVELRSDEERVLWRQFTSARALDSWRDFDLVVLSKMVRLESDIRRYQVLLDKTGPLIQNKRGTMVVNPMMTAVDQLERRLLAMIRSLSLGVSSQDAQVANKSGQKVQDAADLAKIKSGDVVSLLAI